MNFIQSVFKTFMKKFKNYMSKNSGDDSGSGSRNSLGSGRNIAGSGRNSAGSGRNSAGSGRNSAGSGRNSAGSGRNSAGNSDTGNLEQPVDNSEKLNGEEHDPVSGGLWETMMDYQKMLNKENRADHALATRDVEEELKSREKRLDAAQKSVAAMRDEAESKIKEAQANLRPDFGPKPAFANAVNDINADIAQLETSMSAHKTAAIADEKAADANFAAAKNLEGDAGNLEQPVRPDNKKNRLILPVSLGGVLVFFIITAVLLNSRKLPVAILPTVESTLASSVEPVPGLRAGLTMAWVDGSTLVYIPSPNGGDRKNGFWITANPISNYQFSLCIQSGKCEPPTDPNSSKDLNDPSKENQPVRIAGPGISAGYCAWLTGHSPTDSELAGFSDELRSAGFTDDLRDGIHCIVDHPRPMALYCRNSPYYDPSQPIEDLNHVITPKGNFCQDGKSYVTLDITLAEHHTLQTVTPLGKGENCQVVQGNRIVCGGAANSSTSVVAGLVCDGLTGILDSSFADPIAAEDDWEFSSTGAPIPTNGVQFNDLGLRSGHFTPNFVFINGVRVARSLTANAMSSNGLSENGLARNELLSNGLQSNGLAYPVCTPGYYFDDITQTCNSVVQPTDKTCLDGYNLDQTDLCCALTAPNGNYPGCPVGRIFDPITATCDSRTTYVSLTSVLRTQTFDVTFPVCSIPPTPSRSGGGDTGGGDTGGVDCGSITSDSACNATAGCSFDYTSKSCK
jgi:hypothetical protein